MNTALMKLKSSMEQKGIEAVLVTDINNVFYLSGFTGTSAYLIIDNNNNYIFTDFRYIQQAGEQCEGFTVIDIKETEKCEKIYSSYQVCGFEDLNISLSLFNKFRKKFKAVCPIGLLIYDLRKVKTEKEISLIKKAQQITDMAYSHILTFAKKGMTEKEIALELEFFMRKNGASAVSFDIICASGERGALPHADTTDRKLCEGELVVLDFGCIYEGYMSDMTRTFGVGYVSDDIKDVYDTVLEAQTEVLKHIAPGKICSDMHKIAENVIDKKYPGTFGHGLGHSVGIEIHESPNFSPRCDDVICPGNVITVEPGIYIPHKVGVRIEDMVVITEDGYENITKSSKELIYI